MCVKLGELYNQSKGSVGVDWEYETEKRDKEIQELKKSSSKTNRNQHEKKGIISTNKSKADPIPFLFDSFDEIKSKLANGRINPNTSMYYASKYGCLKIIKYLIEEL